MEGKRPSRLQKPSGLKPPEIRTVKPKVTLQDKNKSPVLRTTSSKTIVRRSRSLENLHSFVSKSKNEENEKIISKMQPPTSIRVPQIGRPKLQPFSENVPSLASTSTASTSNNLARGSKSVVDLRLEGNKNKVLSSTIGKSQRIGPTVNKIAQKRKADKSNDEVKPKIVRQVKIPDWDYKGRFNQLLEKFTALNEEHKKQKDKLEDFNDIEEKYIHIKNKHDTLETNFEALTNAHFNTVDENHKLKETISELNVAVNNVTKECSEFKHLLDILTTENQQLSEENKTLSKENAILNINYSKLKTSHIQLKEHDNLVHTNSDLISEYNKKLAENEEFFSNLSLANKELIDLREQNISLRKEVNSGALIRRKLHNLIQDIKGNIRVFCRVRPPLKSEEEFPQCVINFLDEKTIEIRKSRESISAISGRPTDIKGEFTVDKIFDPKSSQEEIFEDLAQLVQSALDGYDVCVFAYGQTGSGKTYTMQGEETSKGKGMIPRTVDLIFRTIKNLKMLGWTYEISVSFLEIYNENVRDLLNPNPTQNLEIRYNEGKGTTVMNLAIQKLNSAEELKNLMTSAQRNRAVATTDFNEHSSRSHAVTKIYLQGSNEDLSVCYTGSVNLVDLAGSESANTSSNERLAETMNIHKSLSALEGVMLALYNKEKHIPYRNSKLTYLLQSCLGGNSKTLIVVNITPFEECFTESIFSLRFAAKVKSQNEYKKE